jgi:hypothetical protein
MTVAQFVHLEDGSDTRYELVGGRPIGLSLPFGRHAEITCNIFRAFDARLPSDFVGGAVSLPSVGAELVLEEIYVGVEFQAVDSLRMGEP